MHPRRPRWRLASAACLLAVGALLGGGIVSARSTAGEITACLDANGYFFQAPAGRSCPGASLTWSEQGPAGPPGPQGAQGPAGPQGVAGTPGAAGAKPQWKVVRKTLVAHLVSAKLGWWADRLPYAGAPASLLCPSGWTAVGTGFTARWLLSGKLVRKASYLEFAEPISTAAGRTIGYAMRVTHHPGQSVGATGPTDGVWPSRKWWVTLAVSCVKL